MNIAKILILGIVVAAAAVVVFGVELIDKLRGRKSDRFDGKASWYGEGYRGKLMANGERFNPDAMTCACWLWPLGTKLEIQHGQRSVIVTVTDRGPAASLDRMIDLSLAAFARIAPLENGVVAVTVREVSR